jgi:hypothetical protein
LFILQLTGEKLPRPKDFQRQNEMQRERVSPKSWLYAIGVLCCLLIPQTVMAQSGVIGLPSADIIARANRYDPPKVGAYAQKLAQQPDMMGQWIPMQPVGAGRGPTWDPVNTFWPPQPPPEEQGFGPIPGTYIKGIPYKPEYQAKYRKLIDETLQGKSRDTFAACFPYGVPRMIGDSPTSFDIVQSPELMIWYNRYGRTERRIFLDGRAHPPAIDDNGEDDHTYSGHSVGHWDGATLVIDTVNMIEGYFDETPAPFSNQVHLVERLRLIDTNILEDQVTVTDPVMLEKPWVVTRYFKRMAGSPSGSRTEAKPAPSDGTIAHTFINLDDRPCVPNVRMDENGFQVILLPQDIEAAKAKGAH